MQRLSAWTETCYSAQTYTRFAAPEHGQQISYMDILGMRVHSGSPKVRAEARPWSCPCSASIVIVSAGLQLEKLSSPATAAVALVIYAARRDTLARRTRTRRWLLCSLFVQKAHMEECKMALALPVSSGTSFTWIRLSQTSSNGSPFQAQDHTASLSRSAPHLMM